MPLSGDPENSSVMLLSQCKICDLSTKSEVKYSLILTNTTNSDILRIVI